MRILTFLAIVFLLFSCSIQKEKSQNAVYNILDYGAVADGKTINTASFQQAIDEANAAGGGKVIVPPGVYMSGCIQLKSNITLELLPGSKILGSPNKEDYPTFRRPMFQYTRKPGEPEKMMMHLVIIKNCNNVTIQGTGTIDGNGREFWEPYAEDSLPVWVHAQKGRVSNMVEIQYSKNIKVKDVKLVMSPEWTMHAFGCTNLLFDGVTIDNGVFGPNNDGIDVTSSENVMISNCNITTCDDAICFKSGMEGGEMKNATVTNCVIKTNCVALKLGSNMCFQRMADITFSNCVVTNSSRGIGLYSTKGSIVENISCNNIVCNTAAPLVLNRPIHLSVWKKSRGAAQVTKPSIMRNITISDFTATTDGRILMVAEDDCILENVTLKNVKMIYPFIEDPKPIAPGHKSSQGSPMNPEARGARAAIVGENIKNLVLDGFSVIWPGDTVPQEWQIPKRIENGTDRSFRYDYSNPRQTELSVLWGKNIQGGYINAPLAKPSDRKLKRIILENSNFKEIN